MAEEKDLTPEDVKRLKESFAAVRTAKNKIDPKLRKDLDDKIERLEDDLEELAHFHN
jgi:hypothetical protein